jgi:hypothetical protein
MLFSSAIHEMVREVSSTIEGLDLNAWYLDDGTLIGPIPKLMEALELIKRRSKSFELKLNLSKCEIWWPSLNVKKMHETYQEKAEHLILNNTDGTELLGSCIGSSSAKEATLRKRVKKI